MAAGSFGLDNLIAIVDVNGQQADGPSAAVMNFEPLAAKFEAFNWLVQRVDGNDPAALVAAFDAATEAAQAMPRLIICDTQMAKGVPFREAHEVVGKLVAVCVNTNRQLWELSETELSNAHEKLDAKALEFVTVEASVRARRSFGGTAPERVREAITAAKRRTQNP